MCAVRPEILPQGDAAVCNRLPMRWRWSTRFLRHTRFGKEIRPCCPATARVFETEMFGFSILSGYWLGVEGSRLCKKIGKQTWTVLPELRFYLCIPQ